MVKEEGVPGSSVVNGVIVVVVLVVVVVPFPEWSSGYVADNNVLICYNRSNVFDNYPAVIIICGNFVLFFKL